MEMVKELGEVDEVQFCWYIFNSEDKMRELFNSINKDSYKNKWFIDCEDFKQVKIIELIKN